MRGTIDLNARTLCCGASTFVGLSGDEYCYGCKQPTIRDSLGTPTRLSYKTGPHVTDLMFRDTTTARMLRLLCMLGRMTQAAFMREYHARCARPCHSCRDPRWTVLDADENVVATYAERRAAVYHAGFAASYRVCRFDRKVHVVTSPFVACKRCNGTGIDPSRSSFHNNFGRFLRTPYACIKKDGALRWTSGTPDQILRMLTDAKLHDAFTQMERQMLAPRATDKEDETALWMECIRSEINRRAS